MALLKQREYVIPILKELNNSEQISLQELYNKIAEKTNLTKKEKEEVRKDNRNLYENIIQYAILSLKQAELIENVARGIYQITEKGKQLLLESGSDKPIDNSENQRDDESSEEQETAFDFVKALNDHSEIIQFSLLDKLISLGESNVDKGNQFEKICLELLLKVMNFNDGTIIGGSGDKGVDLILYVDIVKLTSVGVQCKCTKSTISAKDINHLRGGLEEHGLDKGIFITTSTFSKDAIERVKSINGTNTNIVLINGVKLAELMMEFEVGITKEIHYSYSITLDESN